MKTFLAVKSFDIIMRQCRVDKLRVDRKAYNAGSDFVFIEGNSYSVEYNTNLGIFTGKTVISTTPVSFSSEVEEFDDQKWFMDLLNFFYTDDPKQARKGVRPTGVRIRKEA